MRKLMFVFTVMVILVSGVYMTAVADTLYTSPLFGPVGDDFGCDVTNISGSTVSVTASVFKGNGVLFGSAVLSVPPKEAAGTGKLIDSDLSFYYCKFSTADKTKVRAIAVITNTVSRIYATSEAR